MPEQGKKATKDPNADNWMTPYYITEVLFKFYSNCFFDPCPHNPLMDAFTVEWHQEAFINPPFSEYLKWVEYGITQPDEQIWLGHHNHDARWFKLLMENSHAMCLLSKRVKFIHPVTNEPAGTAIGKCQSLIYRGKRVEEFTEIFKDLGKCVILK